MEKIKILLVSHAFVNERFRASVADELAKFSDFEIKMISPLKASTTHNNLAYLSDKGVGNYKLIPSKTYFTERQTFIIYGKELKNTIKKWRPDIIDIFDETPWSFCVAQTIWLCKKYSPKTKVVFFSDNNVKRNWGGKRFFYRLIERYNCINADRIYFPVRGGTYEKLVKEIGYKGKFSYISSSVDMEKFHRSPAKKIRNLRKKIGLRNNDILLGIIGGLGRYQGTFFKGTLTALNALSNLPGNYKLLIMGKGKDEDKKYLNNYAKKRGIDGSRIIIPGFVDEKEIVDYYSAMDIMIAMSVPRKDWAEPFGRMLIEGMACKIPIIGSNCGAIPLVINNDKFICKVNDSSCLVKKIKYISSNKKEISKISEKAYKRVISEFSTKAMARKRRELYYSVLGRK